ncbi:hypothetical protein H0B56_12885 [Haloechinothrix sp. YIM 98757]|uniref:Uncharacterized protein n=1 Tax=Haloechinothrix aidingensis TaxID=2752311 RepID=A0A838AB47_9PSEU|nr:hypothetical protein [Haloechinothrix aidingensis]MBA0126438.1 hypothetical protein [Haloechinothrix aidingensis]
MQVTKFLALGVHVGFARDALPGDEFDALVDGDFAPLDTRARCGGPRQDTIEIRDQYTDR